MSVETQKETLGFQTEVKQLLHLMIHSLYSNKEIFLRELISNASDAADKLRFEALAKPELLEGGAELKIRVSFDKDSKTVTLEDNGIGMSRDEVIAHLGTIAKSGTADFLKNLSGDQKKDSHLIGQFGVGFYSAFIVADKVDVFTRRAGLSAAEGVHWSSRGEGEFDIANVEKAERGTRIVLHLKAGEEEFADGWRLRNVIKKYSDHIALPIELPKEHYGEEKDKPAEPEWETVNRASALWTRPRTEVKDEEYQEFYKHVAHDFENPLSWSHNKVEGKLEYTSLLYVRPAHRSTCTSVKRREASGSTSSACSSWIRPNSSCPVHALHQGRGGLQRPVAERLPRDPPERPGDRLHEVGADQARAGHAGETGQERARAIQGLLEELRPGPQGRPGGGLRQQGEDRRPAAFRLHQRRKRRAERLPGRLHRPHEGRPGQGLLPHRRILCPGEEQPAPGSLPQERHRSAAAHRPHRRVADELSHRIRRQALRRRGTWRPRPRQAGLGRGQEGPGRSGQGQGRAGRAPQGRPRRGRLGSARLAPPDRLPGDPRHRRTGPGPADAPDPRSQRAEGAGLQAHLRVQPQPPADRETRQRAG
ncbi:hypothetical protein Lal_00048582 [Lupinus albus]|nr:hypothetical protein Lal_00048582 [Lupinus albus]